MAQGKLTGVSLLYLDCGMSLSTKSELALLLATARLSCDDVFAVRAEHRSIPPSQRWRCSRKWCDYELGHDGSNQP